jgi:hypothetical protein
MPCTMLRKEKGPRCGAATPIRNAAPFGGRHHETSGRTEMSEHKNSISTAAFKTDICICPTCGHPVARRGNLVSEIQVAVAAYFHIPLAGMLGPSRRQQWARPRQVAMYLSREFTTFSIAKIARIFSRDQSTASHNITRIEWLEGFDPRLREDIVALRRLIDKGE